MRYVGAERVKEARLQTLMSEFDRLKMKDTEKIDDFVGKLSEISSKSVVLKNGYNVINLWKIQKMAGFPGGCKSVQEYCYLVFCRVTECIDNHKSKEETASYLLDKFHIESPMTNIVWGSLERSFPAFFGSYVAENIQGDAPMAHTQNAQRDASVSSSSSQVPHESATGNAETEYLKEMLDQIKSIQDQMLKVMTDGHGLGHRVENEPVRDDLWQRVLNTLGQIQSTTEQMLKQLLASGHAFGPRPSAAGYSKRQRVEKAEERGGELQENEEGDDEEKQEAA
ncbi:hypothetical protein N665_0012s0144 [Sinapis alba]|nr:hypothetical protein N665_0012s0144 [Sinapis alba]